MAFAPLTSDRLLCFACTHAITWPRDAITVHHNTHRTCNETGSGKTTKVTVIVAAMPIMVREAHAR
jgi:hypothetical protein